MAKRDVRKNNADFFKICLKNQEKSKEPEEQKQLRE